MKSSLRFSEDIDNPFENQKMCLDNNLDELFVHSQGDVWCNELKKRVCNFKTECKKNQVNIMNLPKISILFDEKEYIFNEKDLIYFDDDNVLNCRFGSNKEVLESNIDCSKEVSVVFGKMFFKKFTPLIKFKTEDQSNYLFLISNFSVPNHKKKFIVILIVIFGVLCVAYFSYLTFIKKKTKSHQNYNRVYS